MKRSDALWPSKRNASNASNGIIAPSFPANDLLDLQITGSSPIPRSEHRNLQKSLNQHLNKVWGPLQAVLAPLDPGKWHSDEAPLKKRGRRKRTVLQVPNSVPSVRSRRLKLVMNSPIPPNSDIVEIIINSLESDSNSASTDGSAKLLESYTSSSGHIQDSELFSEAEQSQSKDSTVPLELSDDSDIQEISYISKSNPIILQDTFAIGTFKKDPEREAKINRFISRRGLVEYVRVRFQRKISKRDLAELIMYLGYPDLLVNYQHKNVKDLLKLLYQEVSTSGIHRIDPRNETISDLKYCLLHAKRILVITGAGISTSLNIPDFRSPNGLYPMLALELTNPADVFTLKNFKQNPQLFYSVAYRTLPPENVNVSVTHSFIKLLQDRGVLLRDYTQNIDNLEVRAGLSRDKLVQCHGSYDAAHCIKCNHKYPGTYVFPYMRNKEIPLCAFCKPSSEEIKDNVIKPDITFFGEALPSAYSVHSSSDFNSCDMLIVIGTSLQVAPISKAIHKIPARVPKVLINRELVPYDNFNYHLLGDCDDIVNFIANLMEWKIDNASASTTSCNIMKDNSGKNVYRFGN